MGAKTSKPVVDFVLPTAAQINAALDLSGVARDGIYPLDKCVALLDTASWPPLPQPSSDGWLNVVTERGQTYAQFLGEHKSMDKSVLRSPHFDRWKTLALISADPLPPATATATANAASATATAAAMDIKSNAAPAPVATTNAATAKPTAPPPPYAPDLSVAAGFFRAFFADALKVEVLPALTSLERTELDLSGSRCAETGNVHYSTKAITECVKSARKEDRFAALCVITSNELYRGDDRNEWEIGQAVPDWRVCAVSYVRYAPPHVQPPSKGSDALKEWILKRTLKLSAHEICHLFRLSHCTYLHCLMNGRQNEAEDRATPFDLCPVCFVKLQRAVRFDPIARFNALKEWYTTAGAGWSEERAFVERRLALLTNPDVTASMSAAVQAATAAAAANAKAAADAKTAAFVAAATNNATASTAPTAAAPATTAATITPIPAATVSASDPALITPSVPATASNSDTKSV